MAKDQKQTLDEVNTVSGYLRYLVELRDGMRLLSDRVGKIEEQMKAKLGPK